jgi:alkanesulfonate monooxygenase SsuD/methylene tetrahydromethanopterin reductase-like flavin-dependent oxidoreductase (luciferase family)
MPYEIGTSVLVLPQRNAILVAKQVAALDLLSEGRLILGVGVGWRADELKLLNADFANRGPILDEAIQVLQILWTLAWIGGNSLAALHRVARYCPILVYSHDHIPLFIKMGETIRRQHRG